MFSSQDDQFGGATGNGGLPFDGGTGGPPPADAMFESFLNDGLDDLDSEPVEPRESEVLSAGLHFFEGMKAMR